MITQSIETEMQEQKTTLVSGIRHCNPQPKPTEQGTDENKKKETWTGRQITDQSNYHLVAAVAASADHPMGCYYQQTQFAAARTAVVDYQRMDCCPSVLLASVPDPVPQS